MSSVVVALLHSVRFVIPWRASLHLEIIALRHPLAVVNRSHRPRLRFAAADRPRWEWLAHVWRDWLSPFMSSDRRQSSRGIAAGFAVLDLERRHRTGRPAVPHDVSAHIRDMSTANLR